MSVKVYLDDIADGCVVGLCLLGFKFTTLQTGAPGRVSVGGYLDGSADGCV